MSPIQKPNELLKVFAPLRIADISHNAETR